MRVLFAPNTTVICLHSFNLDSVISEIVPLLYSCLQSMIAFYLSTLWNVACWLILMIFSCLGLFMEKSSSRWHHLSGVISLLADCIILLILSRYILQLFPAFLMSLFFVAQIIYMILYMPYKGCIDYFYVNLSYCISILCVVVITVCVQDLFNLIIFINI